MPCSRWSLTLLFVWTKTLCALREVLLITDCGWERTRAGAKFLETRQDNGWLTWTCMHTCISSWGYVKRARETDDGGGLLL